MDENKRRKLQVIGYTVPPTCGRCAHGTFPNNDWGTCDKHLYDHLKHTGPARLVSVTRMGSCPEFATDLRKDATLGAFVEFATGGDNIESDWNRVAPNRYVETTPYTQDIACISWEVMVASTEEKWVEATPLYVHVADEGLARLAVEWSYQVRLAELRGRSDVPYIEEFPLGEGSSNPWARKLVWQRNFGGGLFSHKDYFDAKEVVFERTIIQ